MTPQEAVITVKAIEMIQTLGMAVAAHLTEASRLLEQAAHVLDATGHALAALAPEAPPPPTEAE